MSRYAERQPQIHVDPPAVVAGSGPAIFVGELGDAPSRDGRGVEWVAQAKLTRPWTLTPARGPRGAGVCLSIDASRFLQHFASNGTHPGH
jgi:hypothetical protein